MSGEPVWLQVKRQVRELPADLAVVLFFVGLANLSVFLPVINDSPIRVVIALVFLLFMPGYAFLAALFPETGESPSAADDGGTETDSEETDDSESGGAASALLTRDRGIDGVERAALSFGLSIALVPLLMLGLTFTPFELALIPILVTISGFTVICTLVGALRRWALSPEERFRVPYRTWIALSKDSVVNADSRFDAALNVALGVAILLAISTLVFAIAAPPDGERFTEFYVLTEDSDGELVAARYPETITPGESEPLHIGIENYEHETVEYSVIVQLQRVEGEANESLVTERAEIDRFSTTLAHNETEIRERNLTVSDGLTGQDLRLTFLLYDGSVPEIPTRENAYRDLHIWVDVEADTETEEL